MSTYEDDLSKTIPSEERIHRFFRHGLDELYPRTETPHNAVTIYKFRTLSYDLKDGDAKEDEEYTVRGIHLTCKDTCSKLANTDVQGE